MADVRAHLFERVLVVAYPDERRRAHATRWLAWMAHHMGSERDLAWWHIPSWIPHWQLGLVGELVFGLVGGLPVGLAGEPKVLFPRWPRPRELSRLLMVGLAFGLVGTLIGGLGGGLVFGLAFGLVALLALWSVPPPHATTATPNSTYRLSRRTSIVVGLVGGLVVGLACGLLVGLIGGLIVALVIGLVVGSMPHVGLAELVLAVSGAGRVKLMKLLEDAHRLQVLRQAGAVYQFRHAELQEYLAKIYQQQRQPSARS